MAKSRIKNKEYQKKDEKANKNCKLRSYLSRADGHKILLILPNRTWIDL